MYINQQDAQNSCELDFNFHYMLYMFRTVLVHLQEETFISCMSYLVYADMSGCCVVSYNDMTARCISIYQIQHTAYKRLLVKKD